MNFLDLQIETGGKTKGKTFCPKCHSSRKNKKDKSLSFDQDKGVYYCHHCEWKGTINEQTESVSWMDFFQERGISPYTLRKLSIKEDGKTIKFPYFQNGEQVNTKHRPLSEKKFWAEKGGKSIPYNIDSVNGGKSVIITEGEMDVLSFIESGFNAVISPPFGANENLNWIDPKLNLLDKIYISVDKDTKGVILKDALINHFGAKKCFIIDTGVYKDANELLIAKGTDGVKSAFNQAKNDLLDALNDKAKEFLLDPDADYERPEVAINIGEFIFGTLGNMSLITGKGKAKKTFLASAIAAASIGAETIDRFWSKVDGICIYFDNEQSKYHAQNVQRRILRLGADKSRIRFYTFRELNTAERLEMIDFVLESTKEKISMVIIDGVRDLLRDINSTDESTTITDHLLRWTSKFNCHIINLLHQNKNDKNARGHIGSELINKSETVISVERWEQDEEVSLVKSEYTRNNDFSDFMFKIDENGLPQNFDMKIASGRNNAKVKPSDMSDSMHWQIVDAIFSIQTNFNNGGLTDRSKYALNEYDHSIGANRSRDFINYWLDHKYIVNQGVGNKHDYIKGIKMVEPDW